MSWPQYFTKNGEPCWVDSELFGELKNCNANGNRTASIRHRCRKTTVLRCHRRLISTGVEKNEQRLNVGYNIYHLRSLIKSKCWYSNNCLHFLNPTFPLKLLLLVSKQIW